MIYMMNLLSLYLQRKITWQTVVHANHVRPIAVAGKDGSYYVEPGFGRKFEDMIPADDLVPDDAPERPSIQDVLASPATTPWLRAALESGLSLDPVDAANQADLLAELLGARVDAMLESKMASVRDSLRSRQKSSLLST